MPERADATTVRLWNRDDDAETSRLSELLTHYHRATESEKAQWAATEPCEKTGVHRHYVDATPESHTVRNQVRAARLPEAYRAEIDDPHRAFRTAAVLLAHAPDTVVGCAVLADAGDGHRSEPPQLELKRLWVEPAARGHGAAAGLVRAAIESAEHAEAVLRLSVWSWRDGAIRLYERLGFVVVASWDARPDLVCLERSPS
ncbi:MAG: GNAT family N-acetyltransferase [Herbiconiux sp.]|uniref:GNAT family N-acetyltransferase n=1 Tax=Herbiconiux sp. TaxID=1871186 RepID=UPI00120F3ECD|nr:GNAT family N-acetyltransferase [Herbiconiux sp.]TAJ46766.1 MAG: GNAT family N-acetyltransferase [Herbiconiux sp.]